ncbi:hypothetical protein BJV82DRAFT_76340 [Fennellomyces sp. T-0311]|nr:hypothetical protein BJV82DRAFT_76340 [Fennellomyces sp. T-0311]
MAATDTDFHIQTDLGFEHLKGLCNHAKHAFNRADYHQAVEIYDRVIDQIQRQLMSKIYLFRASAYERIGNHEQASQDAYRAIFADPTYADGYLCAGHLKHKTDLAEAATLYQTGIDTVSISDPRHARLVELKQQVVEDIRERNTTIMRILPYDLMCHIMEKLSIADRMACAATCKDWHAYMFDSPAMWQDIHQINAPLLDRIGSVASKHVRRVAFQDTRRTEDKLGRLVDLDWCHVESIYPIR